MILPAMQSVKTPSTLQTIKFGWLNRTMLWSAGELSYSNGLPFGCGDGHNAHRLGEISQYYFSVLI